ncbi:hypothetical protein DPEC_G00270350 [Dallia pectoralis]|uniref:Uncharacterized protein n=1 Tax=Dallia pectoralis TaxID=75939 RepID=A0ACC2FPG4_DALPE|nr:hypothetical protein DPEC_G00270350 [Dallia pectoralis]
MENLPAKDSEGKRMEESREAASSKEMEETTERLQQESKGKAAASEQNPPGVVVVTGGELRGSNRNATRGPAPGETGHRESKRGDDPRDSVLKRSDWSSRLCL